MKKFLARNEGRKKSVQDNERNYEEGKRKMRENAQKGASLIYIYIYYFDTIFVKKYVRKWLKTAHYLHL
jgi:hypothetical protein